MVYLEALYHTSLPQAIIIAIQTKEIGQVKKKRLLAELSKIKKEAILGNASVNIVLNFQLSNLIL